MFNWDIYGGHRHDGVPDVCLTHDTVINLSCPLFNKGHHIYMDNYFSSPALFQELHDNQKGACDTLKLSRRGVPEEIAKLKMKKGDKIKATRQDVNKVYINWMGKHQVNLLTTVHNETTFEKCVKCKPAVGQEGQPFRIVQKPKAIELYTLFMGGVDQTDQKACYGVNLHRNSKWWKKAFFHMLEVALVNAGVLFQKYYQPKKCFIFISF